MFELTTVNKSLVFELLRFRFPYHDNQALSQCFSANFSASGECKRETSRISVHHGKSLFRVRVVLQLV